MDRDEIERKQFPSARRGYEPAAVDEHLRRVADEFEALNRRPGSLAEDASARVQAIVAAAETSARQLRDDAERAAAEHVERVAGAARELLARIDELRTELDGMRAGAAGLTASLDSLRTDIGALGRAAEPARTEPAEPAALDEAAKPAADEPPSPAPVESAPAANGARSADEAGARLVALNMALEGSPREATARYLAEQFELADLEALLDDVYASAGR